MTTKLDYNTCANCGRKFMPANGNMQKFCCANCRIVFYNRKWREKRRTAMRPNHVCEACGTKFYSSDTKARYCSLECYRAATKSSRPRPPEYVSAAEIQRERERRAKAKAVYLARRDLEAREAERAVPERVSYTSRGVRIVSRGNCAGGNSSSMRHTP